MPTIPVRLAVRALALSAAFAAPAVAAGGCATPLAPRKAEAGLPALLLQPDASAVLPARARTATPDAPQDLQVLRR